MDDGWKFAESLLGIAAEALKQRAQYKARLEEYQRNPVAGATIALIQSTTRDAALEEAAEHQDDHKPNCGACVGCIAGNGIRAIKSKSSPLTVSVPGEHGFQGAEFNAQVTEARQKDVLRILKAHGFGDVKVAMTNATASSVQCLVPGCGRPHQHEGAHSETSAPAITEETLRVDRELSGLKPCICHRSAYPHVHIAHRGLTADECSRAGKALAAAAGVVAYVVEQGGAKIEPGPVHDFGWALAQMRAGKKVQRAAWLYPETPSILINAHGSIASTFPHPVEAIRAHDVTATDWEVVP